MIYLKNIAILILHFVTYRKKICNIDTFLWKV